MCCFRFSHSKTKNDKKKFSILSTRTVHEVILTQLRADSEDLFLYRFQNHVAVCHSFEYQFAILLAAITAEIHVAHSQKNTHTHIQV